MKKQKLSYILFITVFFSLVTVVFSGCIFTGTYTRNGNNAVIFSEGVRSGSATVSGNTITANFDGQRVTATRVDTGSNPFAGTWRGIDEDGESVEIVFGNSILMAFHVEDMKYMDEYNIGKYDFHGNEAEWELDDYYDEAVISGNRMTGTLFETSFTANRVNIANNPFVGTWRGSVDGVRFELVIGDATWALKYFL